MAECFVIEKATCMLKWSLSLNFKRPFWVAFSTAVDIPDDKGGMAMDILFKPPVRSNGTDGTKLHGHFAIQEIQRERKITSNWHVQSLYVVVISCFQFYFTSWKPKLRELKRWIFFCRSRYRWRECHKMFFWKYMKDMSQVLLFAEFILDIDKKILN